MFSEGQSPINIARTIGVPEKVIELFYPAIAIPKMEDNRAIHYPFKLPIMYLDPKKIHPVSQIVNDDLELNTTIYKELFQPKHEFSENLMKEWSKQITTDVPFLEETQYVIQDMENFHTEKVVDTKVLMNIWNDTKGNDDFLDKYYYMDWNQFLYLNKSASFLQTLTVANVLSPLISLLIPIFFLIFPFLILKIQGIPLTFEMYINVLKETAKHHFIGKTILNIQNLSWEKLVYVVVTFGLYLLQIYQNMNICNRFYNNLKTINKNLIDLREYIYEITNKMNKFVALHHSKNSYQEFCKDIKDHSAVLKKFSIELSNISEFKNSLSKSLESGYLLKCYYALHNDVEYDVSLRYSIGFEGYIDNLMGVYENISSNKMSCAKFDKKSKDKSVYFKGQYYPPFKSLEVGKVVKNNVKLKKNIIITGPNASGKTTLLKTTAINIIISQQLGCGFYDDCNLNPYTHIHSYLNIPDTSERDSLFQAESRRCKQILDNIKEDGSESRHFCIFDELYSGTNPVEATKAAYAFLSYVCKYKNVDFILTTHYIDICKKFEKYEKKSNDKHNKIVNYKMDVNDVGGKIEYTYNISKGISTVEGAVSIFEEMGYPEEILNSFRTN
jgi:hypothetical protein